MLQFNFKDKYYDNLGINIISVYTPYFYSNLNIGGDYSRLNPIISSNLGAGLADNNSSVLIFSGGGHNIKSGATPNQNINKYLIGSDIKKTILSGVINFTSDGGIGPKIQNILIKDTSLNSLIFNTLEARSIVTVKVTLFNCEVINLLLFSGSTHASSGILINRCIIKVLNSRTTYQNNNSFIGINTTIGSIAGNLHTWEKCNLVVNQASLDSYKNNYYAFDDCNFRIGTETDYTPLIGTTSEELRSNFVSRCTAAGLTVPADITDYGITLSLGRWLFTKKQIFEGITWKDSEINLFEALRFISFGYSTSRGSKIPITASNNVPASFAPGNPHSDGLDIADDSLSIDKTVDITQRKNMYLDSKIIWLGAKKKLTKIDIPNDLPYQYGVLIDSIPNLLCDSGEEVTAIEAGEMYMLRSSDENAASVTYSGSTYSSVLSSRNNIFKGVAGVTTFTVASGNPVVYKINDILGYQSVQMRIVNKIPDGNIVSGNLQVDYWYLVEHDNDQKNTTDYVTYSGINYKAGDSFMVKPGVLTFTKSGNIHLRRCWKQDFDFNTETMDKSFWQNEQKPEWCDVLPEDPRCLMKDSHILSFEMARGTDGKYISSGHPEYYNNISGASGVLSPNDIYISGAYMQIRLPITTLNPM